MYSCGSDRDHTGRGSMYQPCNAATTTRAAMQAAGQVVPSDAQPRRPRRRHSASASRRSSTTVVATDVSNFRAMVQELTGFPPAALFRPLPRRAHAAAAPSHSLLAGGLGCGGALQGRGSDGAAAAHDVPAVVQPLMTHPTPGVFDGLPDFGSPEFDAWPDLSSFE